MRIIVTAGPTREYIDRVRFISNASSGQMGCAVARAAADKGHDVTLLVGPGTARVLADQLAGVCTVVPFVSVSDLKRELSARFADCDALVMTAAVGDFRLEQVLEGKLSRSGGAITLNLVPTEDVLAGVAAGKRGGGVQKVVAFAAETGPPEEIEAKARAEMAAKNADYVVVNTPEAMEAAASQACILTTDGVALPWGKRPKSELAEAIVSLIDGA